MSRFVIDSWAWIEYFRGSRAGQRVRKEIARGQEFLTHVVTLAEVISKFRREGIDVEQAFSAMTTSSKVIVLNEIDAMNAGILHASVKERRPNFSLADSFVLHTARKLRARVLTGDPDFRGIDEAVMLR